MRPPSTTTIRSASTIVESRCAITIAVRPRSASSNARWIASSDSESRCDVASSRITIAGFFSNEPRDREALLLAARHAVAALADDRVETVGQRLDEIEDARALECLAQIGFGRSGPREGEVGADRVVEEVRVLRHQPDRGVHRLEGEVAHVVAVDAAPSPARRRTTRGTSIAIVVLPAPEAPTSATVSPGSTTSETSRRVQSLGSSPPGVPGASSDSSETSRPGGWRNHTWSSSMRPVGLDEVDRAGPIGDRGGEVDHLEDALERDERGEHVDA